MTPEDWDAYWALLEFFKMVELYAPDPSLYLTGFEVRPTDPDAMILAYVLGDVRASKAAIGGVGGSSGGGGGGGSNTENSSGFDPENPIKIFNKYKDDVLKNYNETVEFPKTFLIKKVVLWGFTAPKAAKEVGGITFLNIFKEHHSVS